MAYARSFVSCASTNEPATHAVQEPADVDRELLRLRPGEEHAEVQRVEEPLLTDPSPPLHELGVHEGDLARRPAEIDETEAQPEERLPVLLNPMVASSTSDTSYPSILIRCRQWATS